MIVLDEDVVVDRPQEAVFDYLTDIDHYREWQPAIEYAALVDGGPPRPGSRVRLRIRGPGQGIDVEGEVTELRRPDRIGVRAAGGPARMQAACDLDLLTAARTRLRLHLELQPTGFLRFAEGAVRSRVERELPAALDDLRRHLEENVPREGGAARPGTV